MDGISHYESILAEIYEKIRDRVPLSLDDKIDYYLAVHRIDSRKSQVQTSPELRARYMHETEAVLKKARRLEKRLGLDC